MAQEYEIQERVVKNSDCGRFGMNINGIYRPAGYKYKVKVKKAEQPKGATDGNVH